MLNFDITVLLVFHNAHIRHPRAIRLFSGAAAAAAPKRLESRWVAEERTDDATLRTNNSSGLTAFQAKDDRAS